MYTVCQEKIYIDKGGISIAELDIRNNEYPINMQPIDYTTNVHTLCLYLSSDE